jgi:hypothetical protein
MELSFYLLLFFAALFAWSAAGCWLGVVRFRYAPLAILGAGYAAWVAALLLLLALIANAREQPHPPFPLVAMELFVLGAICIFGYRFTFYSAMKRLGITPRRLFGFGASK